ncbi:uncharacterized protein CPUR_03202 [Claviceps purpurea 20.1]|uniref:F-box domain-containing protein n=1 Tax=Claviceps purpurea (strain 20.1) TaxID=1111077 RepID=M1WDL2_CLAP2|nr:uncharacterized protein CPUR_03202 [Claviceps purpurea 20.1]
MAGLIQSGHHSYVAAAKKQKRAVLLIKKALGRCPCNKGVSRPRCPCKDYRGAIAGGYSILEKAMETCDCGVEKFENCYNMKHIKALHALSSMHEAMGELDLAEAYAEWMLELAPRLPDGYLRLGDFARRDGNDEYSWNLYTAGLELYKENPIGSPSKFKQLFDARKPLYLPFFKQDPLLLPPEIVTHIFSYLDFVELPVCLRVCKKWENTLTGPLHCQLWRNMMFTLRRAKRGLDLIDLKNLLSWAGKGGARKIKIAVGINLTQEALTLLLKSSPNLEHLELLELGGLTLPSKDKMWNQLRHVAIESYAVRPHIDVDSPGAFPQTFLQLAASSLENLDLVGIPPQWFHGLPGIPILPNLKTLRMGDHDDDDVDSHFVYREMTDFAKIELPFPIFPLSVAFPKLEQLCIGPDVPYLKPDTSISGQNIDKWEDIWPHLKVFIFGRIGRRTDTGTDVFEERSLSTLRYLTRLNSLQHISLQVRSWDWPCMFSGSYDPLPDLDVNQRSEFQNLRSFSSQKLCMSPDGAKTLLSNAIKANQLISFDIVFPDSFDGNCNSDRHLKGYDWLRGSPSIQTMGCYKYSLLYYKKDNELLLPQFLATFPNLRTLSITHFSNCKSPELVRVLLAILSVTHLKTIYTSMYDDEHLKQLRRVAQDYGVKVFNIEPYAKGQSHLYGARPHQWPIPLSALGG